MASAVRVDLVGNQIKPMTICMIGAGGFIGSHLCEKLMSETPHKVLAVDVYNDKIMHLLEPDSLPWADRIQFYRLNIKNDSRLEGLIKMADLTIILAAICTPADYNTRPLDTIYSNFTDALPVVKYFVENNKRPFEDKNQPDSPSSSSPQIFISLFFTPASLVIPSHFSHPLASSNKFHRA